MLRYVFHVTPCCRFDNSALARTDEVVGDDELEKRHREGRSGVVAKGETRRAGYVGD